MLPLDLLNLIAEYVTDPTYRIRYNVIAPSYRGLSSNPHQGAIQFLERHPCKIDWRFMSKNPSGVPLLREYEDKIVWRYFCQNESPDILPILRRHTHKIYWTWLSANPAAVPFLEENQEHIMWDMLSCNPAAVHLLRDNPDKIGWFNLCRNSSPDILPILEANQDKIQWHVLSSNPVAISLLEQNEDKLDWDALCSNPAAIRLIEESHEIYSDRLCENPAAIHLIKDIQTFDESMKYYLTQNPNAYELITEKTMFLPTVTMHPKIIELIERGVVTKTHLEHPMARYNFFANPNIFEVDHTKTKIRMLELACSWQ